MPTPGVCSSFGTINFTRTTYPEIVAGVKVTKIIVDDMASHSTQPEQRRHDTRMFIVGGRLKRHAQGAICQCKHCSEAA